jgi:hypothetical protein
MAKDQLETIPQTVVVDSPEFNAAVAAAVQAAMFATRPQPVAAPVPAVIQNTSLDQTQAGPDDLTVQFLRFCTFQNSGYQRGQQAGFPRAAAEQLSLSRSAVIVYDPRRAPANREPIGARAA